MDSPFAGASLIRPTTVAAEPRVGVKSTNEALFFIITGWFRQVQ